MSGSVSMNPTKNSTGRCAIGCHRASDSSIPDWSSSAATMDTATTVKTAAMGSFRIR